MSDRREILREIGEVYATNLFESFQDPKMTGPKFTWEIFPDMAARTARVSAFMYFPRNMEPTPEEEEFVAESARNKAKDLVSRQPKKKNLLQRLIAKMGNE